ncbi:MAG: hypothetical protein ABUL64_04225, partial [Singulisphaera sp.]
MKRCMWLAFIACAWCAPAVVHESRAETFYVDSGFSSLSIAVYDHSTSLLLTSAQISGSDTTSLGGTFDATIDSGTITFNSGDISFTDQESDMQPAIGGGSASAGDSENPYPPSPGSDAANYGLFLTVPNDPEDPGAGLALAGVAAIRSAVLGLMSDALTITDGAFDASQVTLGLTAGTLDYNINGGDGTPFIHGSTGIDGNSGVNTLTDGSVGTIGGVTLISMLVYVDVNVTTGGLNV